MAPRVIVAASGFDCYIHHLLDLDHPFCQLAATHRSFQHLAHVFCQHWELSTWLHTIINNSNNTGTNTVEYQSVAGNMLVKLATIWKPWKNWPPTRTRNRQHKEEKIRY
jgi:hypothetical protein